MIPFVFAGQACTAAGACVATTLSAPAWAGVAVVSSAIVSASFLVSKLRDSKASGTAAKEV